MRRRCKSRHPYAHKNPRCTLRRGHEGRHQSVFKTKRQRIAVSWGEHDG